MSTETVFRPDIPSRFGRAPFRKPESQPELLSHFGAESAVGLTRHWRAAGTLTFQANADAGAGRAKALQPSTLGSTRADEATETRSEKAWVLLVEDNRGDILLVKEALAEHSVDADVVVSLDGEQAIGLIEKLDAHPEQRCPRLVILDLNLPKRNGHEVLSHLRKSGRCASLHVIVFSSSNAATDRDAAFREGADEYVCKPSSLQAFLEIGRIIGEALMRISARHR